jgi:hypothetical protein
MSRAFPNRSAAVAAEDVEAPTAQLLDADAGRLTAPLDAGEPTAQPDEAVEAAAAAETLGQRLAAYVMTVANG